MASPKAKTLVGVVEADAPVSPWARTMIGEVFDVPLTTPGAKTLLSVVETTELLHTPHARQVVPEVGPDVLHLWPVPPDWSSPVRERLTWSTEILVGHDLSEQRIGNRGRPVRSFEYDFLMGGHEVAHAEAVIYALQDQPLEIPIWTDAQLLTQQIGIGAQSIPIETAGRDFEAGGRVALFPADYGLADYGVRSEPYEVHDVLAVEAAAVTIDGTGPRRVWPVGARVVPVRPGILDPTVSWTRPTAEGARGSVRVELTEPGWDSLPALVADSYRLLDVLPFRPDRGEDIRESFTSVVVRLESVGGLVDITPRSARRRIGRESLSFLLSGRTEIQQMRAWLEARAGRRRRFCLPSFQRDLSLLIPAEAADDWLAIKSVRAEPFYNRAYAPHSPEVPEHPYLNPGRQDIEILPAVGGAVIRRRAVSWITVEDGIDQVALDEPLGQALVPGREFISWLSLNRHASDSIELTWITADVVRVDLAFTSTG